MRFTQIQSLSLDSSQVVKHVRSLTIEHGIVMWCIPLLAMFGPIDGTPIDGACDQLSK